MMAASMVPSREPDPLSPCGSGAPSFEERLVDALPGVRALLRRRARSLDEAEDALQDAVARALAYRASYRSRRGTVGGWLARTALRALADRRRRAARLPEALSEEPAAPARADAALGEDLLRALATLAPLEREALLRFHQRGESVAAVARALGLPEGTVKSHLHRGRRRLAAALAAREGDAGRAGEERR